MAYILKLRSSTVTLRLKVKYVVSHANILSLCLEYLYLIMVSHGQGNYVKMKMSEHLLRSVYTQRDRERERGFSS